ncbi:MAG: helix-hairpin-helix domain-containing protein [Ignavibacteria bacterium]|nr:helix-hairpin-helix domain-containing protein [Ignavibacteria bacterium]
MIIKYCPVILICAIFQNHLSAQTDILNNVPDTTDSGNSLTEESLLEETAELQDGEENPDFLENLKRNPVDLNSASSDEINLIPFLNSVITRNIISYRNKNVQFKSRRSLLKVDGITEDLYNKIKIYVTAKKSGKNNQKDASGKNPALKQNNKFKTLFISRFSQDLQQKAGYLNRKYEGSKPKIYFRINSVLSGVKYQLETNITLEKDAGEKNLTDFVSGFAGLSRSGIINSVIAGDYTLNFAQGLAMWNSFSYSKGTEAVSPFKKKGRNLSGYRSANEVQFFRGAAADLRHGNFGVNLFYSDNYYDASYRLNQDEISGFYYDGYHRTSSEIQRKNSVKEKLTGGRITFNREGLTLGVTYWRSRFSKPVIKDSLQQLFNFSGNSANMTGADYDFVVRNITVYGEWARSQTGAVASINSLQFTFFRIADILFSYRNYPYDFAPVHSAGFGERSGNTRNERGFYAGISFKPFKGIDINAYFDQFKFPYRSFAEPVSVSGNDFLACAEWKADKGMMFILKYKSEISEETKATFDEYGRSIKRVDSRNQINVRAGMIYQVNRNFRLRSRFEFVNVDYGHYGSDNKGMLFYSDIRLNPLNRLTLDFRYIIFDTDNYDSRIYEFENDIEGVMTNVPLYGNGRRLYLLINYAPFSYIRFSGKYSETYIDGVKNTGSGNDFIEGNINNRLSLGLEIKL